MIAGESVAGISRERDACWKESKCGDDVCDLGHLQGNVK
jgi:hypothetical protein